MRRAAVLAVVLLGGCFADNVRHFDAPADDDGVTPGQAPSLAGLALGRHGGCAALADGTLRCWGQNYEGRLGVPQSELFFSLRPRRVPGIDQVAQVISTGYASCARRDDGTVWCWGARESLGDGSTASRPTPAAVPGLTGVVDLAADFYYVCTVDGAGAVRCWDAQTLPQTLAGIDGATRVWVQELRAGCARLASGTLRCWGGEGGSLGDGSTAPSESPADASGLTDVVDVALTQGSRCALTAAGTVSCWGRDADLVGSLPSMCSALGQPSYPCQPLPTARPELTSVIDLAAGASFMCAARGDGSVWCWGSNQLGFGDGQPTFGAAPAPVTGLSDVVELVAVDQSVCARRSDDQVLCWGDNTSGLLGNGTETSPITTPTAVAW